MFFTAKTKSKIEMMEHFQAFLMRDLAKLMLEVDRLKADVQALKKENAGNDSSAQPDQEQEQKQQSDASMVARILDEYLNGPEGAR